MMLAACWRYLADLLVIHGDLWGTKGGHGNKVEVGLTAQLASKPEEGLLKVVVALGTDIVVLEVLLAVKRDVLGLHLTVLDVNLHNDTE